MAVILPESGPAGMHRPSCAAAAMLAVDEINREGGILGRQLQPVFLDGAEPDGELLSALSHGIALGRIHCVTGWHMSSVRLAVARAVAGRIPYVYPTLYEGGEMQRGVLCVGETPDRQILPALRWFRLHAGVRHWFIAGADYVWPRRTARYVRDALRGTDMEIAGSSFLPHGRLSDPLQHADSARTLLAAIERSRAESVLMLFVGQDGAVFNREFAAHGLDRTVLRFSPSMDETMLLASGPDATRGLCAAGGYFATLRSQEAGDFRARYLARGGEAAPGLNLMAEAAYDGIRLVEVLAHRASALGVGAMERSLEDGVEYESPRGLMRIEGRRVGYPIRLAIANGCEFTVLDEICGL
jgi:ABC-type branched-subunit amino acid transport system substrate-binding protein